MTAVMTQRAGGQVALGRAEALAQALRAQAPPVLAAAGASAQTW